MKKYGFDILKNDKEIMIYFNADLSSNFLTLFFRNLESLNKDFLINFLNKHHVDFSSLEYREFNIDNIRIKDRFDFDMEMARYFMTQKTTYNMKIYTGCDEFFAVINGNSDNDNYSLIWKYENIMMHEKFKLFGGKDDNNKYRYYFSMAEEDWNINTSERSFDPIIKGDYSRLFEDFSSLNELHDCIMALQAK